MKDYLTRKAYIAFEVSLGRVDQDDEPLIPWEHAREKTRLAHRASVLSVLDSIKALVGSVNTAEVGDAEEQTPK